MLATELDSITLLHCHVTALLRNKQVVIASAVETKKMVNSDFQTRIAFEMKSFKMNELEIDGVHGKPLEDDITKWEAIILGPPDSPYEGGKFRLGIELPEKYPFSPPKIWFRTRVWHPNIGSVTGVICLDILKTKWIPTFTLKTILISIRSLLCDPNPDSPQESQAAEQLLRNPKLFEQTAREWSILHAGASPPSQSEPSEPVVNDIVDDPLAQQSPEVRQLVEMGIFLEDAIATLQQTNNNIVEAVNILFGTF